MNTPNEILEQIKNRKHDVSVRQISISVIELLSWQKKGRVELNPSYQRKFRWSESQQSKLIESIVLGLPLPSIFFYSDGRSSNFEVMDGLQRITTLLEFFNDSLCLKDLEQIPSLNGLKYSDFPVATQFDLEGSRLDLQILISESLETKYDLFIRLNSGGSSLTEQEIRNCLFDQSSPIFAEFLHKLSLFDDFNTAVNLSEGKVKNGTLQEYILRWILLLESDYRDTLQKKRIKMGTWLTTSGLDLIERFSTELELREFLENTQLLFEKTFKLLSQCNDPFRRNKGGTSFSSFELVAIGLGKFLKETNYQKFSKDDIERAIVKIFEEESEKRSYSYDRVVKNVERGFEMFKTISELKG